MPDNKEAQSENASRPDPALRRLDRLVGSWRMQGRPVGSNEDTISGTTTFMWLHETDGTSFFLQQDMEMDYDGRAIKSREIIGYNQEIKAFTSSVYSNMAPEPWPYEWNIAGDNLTISIQYGAMNATFRGKFSADGNSFAGGWRPNPGADETINAAYDITVTRID